MTITRARRTSAQRSAEQQVSAAQELGGLSEQRAHLRRELRRALDPEGA